MTKDELIKHFRQLYSLHYPNEISDEERLDHWKNFVWNENFQSEDKQRQNIRKLFPKEKTLCFPLWIMDRLKEAMDQYVKGQWSSSIALCGMIVEFLMNSMLEAYKKQANREFPNRELPNNLAGGLLLLYCIKILDKEDFEKLDEVRKLRNNYIHLKKLSKNEQEKQKEDNFKALENLIYYFDIENISKYSDYLRYLLEESME